MARTTWESVKKEVADYKAANPTTSSGPRELPREGWHTMEDPPDVVAQLSRKGDPQVKLTFDLDGWFVSKWLTFSDAAAQYAMRDIIKWGVDVDGIDPPEFHPDGTVSMDTDAVAQRLEAVFDVASVSILTENSEYVDRNGEEQERPSLEAMSVKLPEGAEVAKAPKAKGGGFSAG